MIKDWLPVDPASQIDVGYVIEDMLWQPGQRQDDKRTAVAWHRGQTQINAAQSAVSQTAITISRKISMYDNNALRKIDSTILDINRRQEDPNVEIPVSVHRQCSNDCRHEYEHKGKCPALTLCLTRHCFSARTLHRKAYCQRQAPAVADTFV